MNALNERVRKEVRYGPLRSQQERILSFRLPRSLHTNIHALKQATTISTYFPSHGSQSRRQMTVKRRYSGAVSCILRAVKTPPLFFWVTQALTVKAARPFQKPVFPCKSTRRRAAFWAPRRGGGGCRRLPSSGQVTALRLVHVSHHQRLLSDVLKQEQ
jgi:hypothetical protein